jgi:hypothetical protein
MQTLSKLPLNTTPQSTTITTNLFELIEAVQNQVEPENDALVVATVMYILRARRATFLYNTGTNHCN